MKKLDKWVPHELTTSQSFLKHCLLLFYVTTANYFLIRVWHVIKSGFYMTTNEDQLSGWMEKKIQSISQSQTCTHKSPCSLFGGLLPLWSTTTFSILVKLLQEGDPFKGPKLGSCLTLRDELSEETHVLTKQEILLGKGARVESRRARGPRRTALPRGSQSRVLWWWD